MDKWLYFEVTHAGHVFCNPIGERRIDELIELLELERGARVLDFACGHGEFLIRLAQRYGCRGIGVDLSPHFVARARGLTRGHDIEIVEADGKEFRSDERFDAVSCIGASWIWDGCLGTLEATLGFAKPGGLLIMGEPFWREDPPAEYLEAEGLERDGFPSLDAYRTAARGFGLEPIWMAGSTEEEWDRYEMLQDRALDRFARANPDHPELPEIRERRRKADEAYLRWGRPCLGFALWVFRVPG